MAVPPAHLLGNGHPAPEINLPLHFFLLITMIYTNIYIGAVSYFPIKHGYIVIWWADFKVSATMGDPLKYH